MGIGLSLLCSQGVNAGDNPEDVTDRCVLAVRDVYRFYYREVHPNPDPACHTNHKMSDDTAQVMQNVMNELKESCPPTLIIQISQSLQLDTETG